MEKFKFTKRVEWSDRSEFSPSCTGSVPITVVLPSGERIGTETDDLACARNSRDGGGPWVRLHERVTFKENHWGDPPERNVGRGGYSLVLHAPKGSQFVFGIYCPICGEQNGEEMRDYDDSPRNDLECAHPDCQADHDAEMARIKVWMGEIEQAEIAQAAFLPKN